MYDSECVTSDVKNLIRSTLVLPAENKNWHRSYSFQSPVRAPQPTPESHTGVAVQRQPAAKLGGLLPAARRSSALVGATNLHWAAVTDGFDLDHRRRWPTRAHPSPSLYKVTVLVTCSLRQILSSWNANTGTSMQQFQVSESIYAGPCQPVSVCCRVRRRLSRGAGPGPDGESIT